MDYDGPLMWALCQATLDLVAVQKERQTELQRLY